jgi:4-hydroxythreonine-4-phosphate dehydrogenase
MTLGITLGDVTGVGPEVALRAVARLAGEDTDTRFVLIGDSGAVRRICGLMGLESDLPPWLGADSEPARVYSLPVHPETLPGNLPAGHRLAALSALAALEEGTRRCLSGEFDGLVTAPVSKEAILRAGIPFVGQTEFLAELSGTRRFAMMLLGHDDRGRWLRVSLATTHLPLSAVPAALTRDGIAEVIALTSEACDLLGLTRRRIGVCGLNPHAGEGGHLGTEEIDHIRPAVEKAVAAGLDVRGPSPADTLFHQVFRGDYEAVVAMYHDQGLAPLKMVAFDSGVNWTLGLPFVRTSPDHGTAYDIAGQGLADPSSMESAIRLALQVAATGLPCWKHRAP